MQAEAAREVRALLGADGNQNALIANLQAQTCAWRGDYRCAVPFRREAVRLALKTSGPDHFGVADWQLELAMSLEHPADAKEEAGKLADDLLRRFSGKPAFAGRYAELVLLRCRLHSASGERAEARALSAAALVRQLLVADADQRQALGAFASAR